MVCINVGSSIITNAAAGHRVSVTRELVCGGKAGRMREICNFCSVQQ